MSKPNKANPHTVKKFELVEGYVKSWIQKLMNFASCKEVVFIDCMCNNGLYEDDDGKLVYGTPIRVAEVIAEAMKSYPRKVATLYFNDSDSEKIAKLKGHLPHPTDNFRFCFSVGDGNNLLKILREKLLRKKGLHYLLFYDPYKAAIDWEALAPYFFGWGEVIINHMVSDTVRALKSAKRPKTIDKYEQTYLLSVEELANVHGDKHAYDEIIKNIIKRLRALSKHGEYYLAAFPFFIKTNVQIYSIIFFTNNKEGFKLFKTTAWKTFGGKSSNQRAQEDKQISLFDTPTEAKDCYFVSDIADYIIETFKGSETIPLQKVWDFIDENHPVFPTKGYMNEIKEDLKQRYGCEIHGRKKEEQTITFIKR